jgi:NADH-quinone oxidoreductase subunit J
MMAEYPSPYLFWPLALVVILGALGVLTLRNVLHGALCLMITLFGVAGIYVSLSAPFLAGIQVMIYVGAVSVLLAFAVMLTDHHEPPRTRPLNDLALAAGIAAASGALFFSLTLRRSPWGQGPDRGVFEVQALGAALMGEWLLPFELLSLVFLAAIIGGVCLVRKEKSRI